MNTFTADSESVATNDILNLASWNRPRTIEELRNFVNTKHALLPEGIEIE
jgi:hypothetical protein